MTDVDVKARFQTGTTGNSSNQILKISDSDIARGVFYVFVLRNNRRCSPSMERPEVERLKGRSEQARALQVWSDQRSSVEAV